MRGGDSRRSNDLDFFVTIARKFLDDVCQIHRLIAPMRRMRAHRTRQQIRRIGFDHQPVGGYALDQFAQVQAATLVAQPAGDADMPTGGEVIVEFGIGAGEAVHHRRTDPAIEVSHQRHEIRMRVALVQKQRLARINCDLQLHFECATLRRTR